MCDTCGWDSLLEELDELLEKKEYDWAKSTLSGIREWVDKTHHCTKNQQKAVRNIRKAVDK